MSQFKNQYPVAMQRSTQKTLFSLDLSIFSGKVLRNLLVCFFAVILTACEQKLPSPFKANDVSAKYGQVTFQLTDTKGKLRRLSDFKGKVVALFFGYTHCPDVCPTTLADMALVMEKLGKDVEKFQVLFITVDPERDTPALLAQYVPAFDPSFIALYGDVQTTAQVTKSFDVTYQKQEGTSGYSIDHSVGTFLIDPRGKVRLLAPYAQRAEWLAADIRLLLAGV